MGLIPRLLCLLLVWGSAQADMLLPAQVYRYNFDAIPAMNAVASNAEAAELIEQANAIWAQAGIGWYLAGINDRTISRCDLDAVTADPADFRSRMTRIAPAGSGWRIVLVAQFPIPGAGLYLPEVQTIYFAEWSRGNLTSPIVLAHELGHSLALGHTTLTNNLMHPQAGLYPYTLLNRTQRSRARSQALIGPIGN